MPALTTIAPRDAEHILAVGKPVPTGTVPYEVTRFSAPAASLVAGLHAIASNIAHKRTAQLQTAAKASKLNTAERVLSETYQRPVAAR